MNFEKTYLSRQMTRAMSLDHPIGDPFGGPAYGERREPVSAVLAIGSMVAGYGAATAAGATLGAMVLGGMAMAGGALSLVGNVTGNAKLQKFGSIVGLIGSGGLALSNLAQAGATAGVESAAGQAAAEGAEAAAGSAAADAAAQVADDVVVNAAPAAQVAAPTVLDTPNLAAPLEAANVAPPSINAPTIEMPAPPAAPLVDTVLPGSPTLNAVTDAAMPGQGPGVWDSIKSAFSSEPKWVETPGGMRVLSTDAAAAGGSGGGGLISDAMNFTKTNPMGAYVAAQAIGGAAEALSGKTGAQKRQLEADANLRQANADKVAYEMQLAKERLAALNNNYKTVNRNISVDPNVQLAPVDPRTRFVMMPVSQTGLIAGNRPA
jgi:hypothetical protein